MQKTIAFLLFAVIWISNLYGIDNSVEYLVPDTFDFSIPNHYVKLSTSYISDGELNHAKKIIEAGLIKGEKENNNFLISKLKYNLADYYYYKENYNKAKDTYIEALPLLEINKDTLVILKALNSIGITFSFEQDYNNALIYYLKAINLNDKTKNRSYDIDNERLNAQVNILNLYSNTDQPKKAIEYAPSVIVTAIELNDSINLATILNSLGVAYKYNSDFDKSIVTLIRAASIFKTFNNELSYSSVCNNIGSLYEENTGKLDSALYYYNIALNGFDSNNYRYGISKTKAGIASVLLKKNKIKESRKLYNEILETSLDLGQTEILQTVYYDLSLLEYQQKNYKDAYEIYIKYRNLSDSIFSIEKEIEFTELSAKYETTQKENEINILKTEKLEHELIIKKQKFYRQIGLFFIIFLILIIYIGSRFYDQKKKAHLQLLEKNGQINIQNEQISIINTQLQKSKDALTNSNNAKNKFFSILAHDLRNPFHNVLGQSFLFSNLYEKLNTIERKQYADEIYNSCEQVNRLLENLLEWSRTQSRGVEFNPVSFKVEEIVSNAISVLQKNAISKSIKIKIKIEQNLEIVADKSMLETVFRNLINNSIKFTPENGELIVSAKKTNNKLNLSVEDNGVGIENTNIDKLFKIESNIKTLGTNTERGTGLGLVICKEFVNYHKGKIWLESKEGKGTIAFVEIPLT